MGLFLSVVIAYAGIQDAIETIRHILSGLLPETDPDFQDLVDYYTKLLHKSANPSSSNDWTEECGQGYLCLTDDKNGNLKSAAVKYYGGQPNSTAILFSTKISSFGQESVEEIPIKANGDYRSTERYIPTQTKTIITNTSESFNVGYRNRSPTPSENISDSNHISANSFERDTSDAVESDLANEKLTWHYRPLSPTQEKQTLPEIHFQSLDEEKKGVYSDDFLRSLDGIKYRPLQRSDPSGRRRSFKKRHSSSSNSSKESRASRDEELKMFTSLEETEFERMNNDGNYTGFGSTPNLAPRSNSRSRSRENSRERRHEAWSVEASVDSLPEDDNTELKLRVKDLSKLDSFEEETDDTKDKEVTAEDEDVDFWGNSGD
ncbi:uncharacterized protein LOC131847094 isoform X1 [Achroia grisella]|uniref:uncharacterized protein LOC131847094 isoform X1 n=1 Tax=Achroia grisella TaxID=688607 RepID=UPI0027D2AF82|nr:uncharacterized protein LOC131847094 isoform X1 [Achroia grisella]